MVDRAKKIAEGIGLVTLCYVGMALNIAMERYHDAKDRIYQRDKTR